jgi:hypothetical protein
MKKINYWDYCNTEFHYRTHDTTLSFFVLCISSMMLLSPLLLLYIFICSRFTISVPNNYKVFKGE